MSGFERPLIVNWGFGVNSTALIVELCNRAIVPDLVIAADTLGEKPETYEYKTLFEEWLIQEHKLAIATVTRGITNVRKTGRKVATDVESYSSLEQNCIVNKTLPSLAFGMKGCSQKWKREPIDWYADIWPPAVRAWAEGRKVTKALGYDAGESRRAGITDDEKYHYVYPLIDWGMTREDCVKVLEIAGLPVPPKSACFYCPASKKSEIVQLSIEHPELYARALAMEENAVNLGSTKGLGRSFAWSEVQSTAAPEVIEQICMCYDGEESTR